MFGKLSGTKAAQTEGQLAYSTTFGFGGDIGGGGTVTSGGVGAGTTLSPDVKPTPAGISSAFFRPAFMQPLPAQQCDLAGPVRIPDTVFASVSQAMDPFSQEGMAAILEQMPLLARLSFKSAIRNWSLSYPHAPAAVLSIGSRSGDLAHPAYLLTLSRPYTDYDPALDRFPLLQQGTEDAKIFGAGMRLFFPDYILDSRTGANLRQLDSSSMTVDGPFPYWEKFVSPRMVNYAVELIKTTPDLFQPPRDTSHWDFNFARSLSLGITGLKVTRSPIIGVGVAAASLLYDTFAGLFSWLSDSNPPPPWLTKLLVMKQLRGDTAKVIGIATGPDERASFGQLEYFGSGHAYPCKIAYINPPSDGRYTVSEGYLEVLRRVTGQTSPWKIWALVALAVGAGYYLLGD